MMRSLCLGLVFCALVPGAGFSQTRADQIAEAVLPLPDHLRDGATVSVEGPDGTPQVIRQGTNGFFCMRDSSLDYFRVGCIHEATLPMNTEYGRLLGEGLSLREAAHEVFASIRAGNVQGITTGARSYVASGPDANDVSYVMAVFIPQATGESLGLPTRPEDGGEWLMCAGTPLAHIMFGDLPYGDTEENLTACEE